MKIISIANEKGGVGKTTSPLNLGAAFAKAGYKTLLIDLDPQANLSEYLGFEADGKATISELIYNEVAGIDYDIKSCIRTNTDENIDYLPSSKVLSAMVSVIGSDNNSQEVLKRLFSKDVFKDYDYIIFDCKPSLDLLVCNAFAASDSIIIPVQAELFAYNAVANVINTINKVKQSTNPTLDIAGILITMYRKQTTMSKEVSDALSDSYDNLVLKQHISLLTEAAKSTVHKKSLINTQGSILGREFENAAREILERM